jgi:hypothetical protein
LTLLTCNFSIIFFVITLDSIVSLPDNRFLSDSLSDTFSFVTSPDSLRISVWAGILAELLMSQKKMGKPEPDNKKE